MQTPTTIEACPSGQSAAGSARTNLTLWAELTRRSSSVALALPSGKGVGDFRCVARQPAHNMLNFFNPEAGVAVATVPPTVTDGRVTARWEIPGLPVKMEGREVCFLRIDTLVLIGKGKVEGNKVTLDSSSVRLAEWMEEEPLDGSPQGLLCPDQIILLVVR